MRATTTRRGSTFFRCSRADVDARFVRYPPLPKTACAGYEDAMFFVVLLHYQGPLAAVDAVRADHLQYVEQYAAQGIFHAWARRDPPVGGVLVATAPDRATLESVIARDPYVTAGVARAEVVAFSPASVRGALRT